MRGFECIPNLYTIAREVPWKVSVDDDDEKRESVAVRVSEVGCVCVLDLSLNEISVIKNLPHTLSQYLLSLNLSRNLIGEIRNISNFAYLLELDLSNNNIRVVQGLGQLTLLRSLVCAVCVCVCVCVECMCVC